MAETVIFTPDQARTLYECWRDRDHFWFLCSIFADDVQQRSEEWADALRWLVTVRQKPWVSDEWAWWWCSRTDAELEAEINTNGFSDFLPADVYEGHAKDRYPAWGDGKEEQRVAFFEEAVRRLAALSPARKAKLWALADRVTRKESVS